MKRIRIRIPHDASRAPLDTEQLAVEGLEQWRDRALERLAARGLRPNKRLRKVLLAIESRRAGLVAKRLQEQHEMERRQPELDAFGRRVGRFDAINELTLNVYKATSKAIDRIDASVRIEPAPAARPLALPVSYAPSAIPHCPACQRLAIEPDDIGNWWCSTCERWFNLCAKCGVAWRSPQSPLCKDKHEASSEYHPFIPYFDFALGKQVDSLGQRKALMRENNLDYRDKMTKGDLSARNDRIHQQLTRRKE